VAEVVNYTEIREIASAATSSKQQKIWRVWNSSYTSASTISWTEGSCNHIQCGWPFTTYTATSNANVTITQYAWSAWNDQYEELAGLRAVTDVQTLQRYTRRKMSDSELKAALEQEKQMREAAEARLRKAEEAKRRAEALLIACLSAQQREDLDKKNCFYIMVDGKDGKKERYRIDRGSHGNVKQVDDRGSIIRSFCIQPAGVPEGDILLTQKLWLEASEETREEFWATANITTLMKEKEVPAAIPRRERRKYAEAHGLLH
jgi:hypothetical protein